VPATPKKTKLLSDEAVAERLGVSRATVKRMRYADELPTVMVRGAARIPEQALDDWIAANTGSAKAGS
jgi:excisionase family DNA binding protein